MRRIAKISAGTALGMTAALTIGLSAAGAAAAGPIALGANSARVNYGQLAANAVAQRLQAAMRAGHLAGFSGIEVNASPTHPGVTVYWHGQVPARLSELAATVSTARATHVAAGVTVRFRPAPYTRAQLVGLMSVINDSPRFLRSGISSMGFFPRATGFWINVDARADLARARLLVGRTAIAVHYRVSPGAELSVHGRYKDEPPFLGGDFIETKVGAAKAYTCSSGFPMHFANKKGAPWFMLTAGHCIWHSKLAEQRFWIEGNKKHVGLTFTLFGNDDTSSLLMSRPYAAPGAGGAHHIYIGSTSRTSTRGQKAAEVIGAMAMKAGDVVSTSGAFSGQCNGIKVKTLDWEWMGSTVDGTGYRVFGALALQEHHRNAAGHGDSGGPVFVQGKGGVKAVGIISATDSTKDKAPCTGVDLDRGCYWSLEFPLMTGTATSIETEMNLKVNT